MIVINNKNTYSGTVNDMLNQYSVSAKCLCNLQIEEVNPCREFLYAGLPEIEFFN